MKILRIVLILTLAVCCMSGEVLAQCAMCRATIETSASNGGDLAAGLNAGILYLATIPYLMLGGLAYFWYRSSRSRLAS